MRQPPRSPLAGKLFDANGEPLYVQGAVKGQRRYRRLPEFRATSQTGWMVLETSSVSHGKASAYLPVIDFAAIVRRRLD